MRLDGKRVLVTGGAGGIGRAIAERLHRAGGTIVLADLSLERARDAAAQIGLTEDPLTVDCASEEFGLGDDGSAPGPSRRT